MSINSTIDGLGIPENEFANAENNAAPGMPISETSGPRLNIMDILLTQTGPEDDYINHPLNFAKSEGLGQIIRGVTGFLQKYANVSSLKLALLDIVFGYFRFTKELRGENKDEHVSSAASA